MNQIFGEVKYTIHMNGIIRSVCMEYINHDKYFEIRSMYDDNTRHYHNWNHVLKVAAYIEEHVPKGQMYNELMLTAFLHDAVYDTKSLTNEIDSAELVQFVDAPDEVKRIISDTILFTTYKRTPENVHEIMFMAADLNVFNASSTEQIEFERNIFREYFWVPVPVYVQKRIEILRGLHSKFGCDTSFLVKYLESKKWNIGFYPGTFYPFHKGHSSVLRQAEAMFDKVIIGFGDIGDKTKFEWDTDTYGELNGWVRSNYETVELKSLITENVGEIRRYADNITIIRGLRNSSDLIYEQNYLQALRDLDQGIMAAYFMTEPGMAHISSSLIRGILKLSPKDAYKYYK